MKCDTMPMTTVSTTFFRVQSPPSNTDPPFQNPSLQRYQGLPSIDLVTEKTMKITEAVTILRDAIRTDNLCRLPEVREMMLSASRGVASIFPQVPTSYPKVHAYRVYSLGHSPFQNSYSQKHITFPAMLTPFPFRRSSGRQ